VAVLEAGQPARQPFSGDQDDPLRALLVDLL